MMLRAIDLYRMDLFIALRAYYTVVATTLVSTECIQELGARSAG